MILAMDLGGTAVKLGLVDERGVIHARAAADVSRDGYRTPIFTTALRAAREFLNREGTSVEGVGISATGQIDDESGVVIGTNGKIPHYEGARLKDEAEAALGVEAWALNDANAAVLGECFAGAARGERDVVMITLGTGVGGGIITGGQLLRGARGIGGELGHFTLYQDGEPCPCGKRGCYESYAATTALVRRCEAALGRGGLDGRQIFELAKAGDAAVRDALDGWIADIAAGLTGLIHIFNPRLVLVGGGVSVQEELLLRPLRAAVMASLMPRFAEGLRLERSALGNDAGMIGAAKYWLDRACGSKTTKGK